MHGSHLSNAAIILLGHGTTQNPESATNVIQHASRIRQLRLFSEVREAFWKQEPTIQHVLPSLQQRSIYIVPMFMSEGFFSDHVIPNELGFQMHGEQIKRPVLTVEDRTLYYCRPVGSHPEMTKTLLEGAEDVLARFPFPQRPRAAETTLFVAGHGTMQNANSRKNMESQVQRLRELKIYADVHAIFLDESPPIAACYDLARTRNIVVVPYFMGDGLHVTEDIPILLGEPEKLVRSRLAAGQPTWRNPTEKRGKRVWYSRSIGNHPGLTQVILDCVREVLPE